MTKSRTRNTQENSEMDYELLKAHYCDLQDENTILQERVDNLTDAEEYLRTEVDRLKMIITILLEMKNPLDKRLRDFFRATLIENLENSHRHFALDDEIPF